MGPIVLEEHEFQHSGDKTTFYLAAGPQDGPLLIFLHGWPAIAQVWKPQLETFASLGFRAVAPDMPGYGRSTARKVIEDYAQETINKGMLALLEHLGREEAIWIGHDWGCGSLWTFAAHYPEKCVGVAGMTVPYHTIELGLEELLKTVNRELYPPTEYPWGQWSYMRFYETEFERATAFFDADVAAVVRLVYSKGSPDSFRLPALTSNVSKDGGWFGGLPAPDPAWARIPIGNNVLDEETYDAVVAAMKRTGFWPADAWYANHARNRAYTLEGRKNGGVLEMPVLFVEAKWDGICATACSRMAEPMRKYCRDLTEVSIDSGHWVAEEKPAETSAALARWILERCKRHWPGYWSNGHVSSTA